MLVLVLDSGGDCSTRLITHSKPLNAGVTSMLALQKIFYLTTLEGMMTTRIFL